MNDARADFEAASAAATVDRQPTIPVADGEPPVAIPENTGSGYVVHEDLAVWISAELTPKLQALVERLTALEADMRDLRQQVAERYDNTSQAQGEWAETFNRAQAQHDEAHGEIESRLGVLEESMIQAGPQPAPAESGA